MEVFVLFVVGGLQQISPLCGVEYEASAVISANGFLYLYQYYYVVDSPPLELLLSFAVTTLVPLAIEWFFARY